MCFYLDRNTFKMRFPITVSAILSLSIAINAQHDQGLPTWGKEDPVVTIVNMSGRDYIYDVERDSQSPPGTFASCTGCIKVPAGKTIRFHPGQRFNGAVTANHHRGTRHELNFLSAPGECWYDDDMERGMSDETLGPTDHRRQPDGSSSLVGEADVLAKANAAWAHTPAATQQALLHSGYFKGTVGGKLAHVSIDQQAGSNVVDWFQLDAAFDAYIATGSVAGRSSTQADLVANRMVRKVSTTKMTITIHS